MQSLLVFVNIILKYAKYPCVVLYMQSVLIIQCFICKVCPYYVVPYMQSVLIM